MTRWLALHTILAAGLVSAHLMGWLAVPFVNDGTHMTTFIAAFAGAGAVATLFPHSSRYAEEIANACMVLGLLGTVVGIAIATKGGVERMDLSGLGTALMTTLVGGVSYLWLRLLIVTGR